MGPLLSNISKDHRFHRPGTADLAQDVKIFVVDTPDALTDAQLLALTLNEICVLKGKGHALHMVPEPSAQRDDPFPRY